MVRGQRDRAGLHWRPGQRGFAGTLGSLLLGTHDPDTGQLVYIGDVGTGFSHADRDALHARLQSLARRTHPFAITPPRKDTHTARWAEPELVGEVVYRHSPAAPGACATRPGGGCARTANRSTSSPPPALSPHPQRHQGLKRNPAQELEQAETDRTVAATTITVQAGKRRLTLSNLNKPLYPDGFSKGQVLHYYSTLADVLLPLLKPGR
ncbi:ATP dependent DNA ligase [Amycolatopsis magusensis]|uniref:DNA ligase (ATP) n=1 Tax=Amycolatopsis magusensis TaxID=882444 RepID=A0ABS4PVT1_9PSEU|nr:hypothetical protein [Amycolatopsis magusensis]MBP2182964.1 hypothetical protein [Amycolatopsis magusensis]